MISLVVFFSLFLLLHLFFPPELPSYSSPIAIRKISPEVHGKPVSFQAEEILPSFSSEIACLGGMIERNER